MNHGKRETGGNMMRRARWAQGWGVALSLGAMVVGIGAAALAQTSTPSGAAAAGGASGEVSPPTAPNLSAVKGVVKEAVSAVVPGGQPAAPAASAHAPPDTPATRAAALRIKVLRDEDFIDQDDTNRDPFKSFLRLFVEKTVQKVRTVPAIFEKFALEELGLIAIVSGDSQPRAMFRDPAGLGQTIKRGDYISKAGARVTKILSDRVIVELSEITTNGESRPLEKAILLNPEETQK